MYRVLHYLRSILSNLRTDVRQKPTPCVLVHSLVKNYYDHSLPLVKHLRNFTQNLPGQRTHCVRTQPLKIP